ncbi:conserved hypothetical protein [Candidatus Propionivibrio aalborgensis]|uniref:Uncharacterized protein n=1 Tax=Candidatus Propionivibrio aalborgensis TaxID=1860101 RepID=A0A1A8Y2F2_9RHOO|nr:hypothetical protein [Candidatus Propionivibrio aalborgensis]SBT11131.1 conserved hypothetical protein [Candidatus Propionivibrio aalborgensis]
MALTQAEVTKNLHRLAPYNKDRVEKLHDIERQAFARFRGQFDELEAALGMLHLGDHVGWKPLVLIHNKRTIRKYEAILGIEIREFFPPEGPSAERSLGYSLAKKIGNFWKAVSGEIKSDELKAQRREIA